MDLDKIESFVNQPVSKKRKTIKFLFSDPGYLFVFFPTFFLMFVLMLKMGDKYAHHSTEMAPESRLCYSTDFLGCAQRLIKGLCGEASKLTGKNVCFVNNWGHLVARHWTPPVMEPEQISCKPTKDRRCA